MRKFTPEEVKGAIAVNIFAVLSTLALVSVAIRVIWLAINLFWARNHTRPREYVFFHTQLGQYAACLLIANFLNSAAGLVGLSWLSHGGITEGWMCTAQAIIMQMGNFSTAYFTVTIAVHTFKSLVLRKKQSVIISIVTISIGWILALLVAIGPVLRHSRRRGPLYGADGIACDVRQVYPMAQFLFHLLPIFIASVLSAILYSLIFLILRGTLKIKGGLKLTLNPDERWCDPAGDDYHKFVATIAMSMIWYPVAYVVTLLPYSVMRLLIISRFEVSFGVGAMAFAYICWFLLGVVNVLLLYNTFRVLGPAFDAHFLPSPSGRDKPRLEVQSRALPTSDDRGHSLTLEEKIERYRSSPSLYRPTTGGSWGDRESAISIGSPLSTHLGRTSNNQSFERYSNSSSIGRAIVPTLNWESLTKPPAVQRYPSTSRTPDHVRQDSFDSSGSIISTGSLSLPVPPRRSRPPITRQTTLEEEDASARTTSGTRLTASSDVISPMSRQFSSQTLGPTCSARVSSSSISTQELDDSNWTSRHGLKGVILANSDDPPMLSAVTPSFPQHSSGHLGHNPAESRSGILSPATNPPSAIRQHSALVGGSVDRGISEGRRSFSAKAYYAQ